MFPSKALVGWVTTHVPGKDFYMFQVPNGSRSCELSGPPSVQSLSGPSGRFVRTGLNVMTATEPSEFGWHPHLPHLTPSSKGWTP